MPFKKTVVVRPQSQPPREQEETEMKPAPVSLKPVGAQTLDPGRTCRVFVESEARKYWQEITKIGRLSKPAQQDIRAAAMPILGLALRNRYGSRRQQAVAVMAQRALENGWIKPPCAKVNKSPSYVAALVELARDAGWHVFPELVRSTLIMGITGMVQNDYLRPFDAIRMVKEVEATWNIGILCWMYEQLASVERQNEWARRLPDRPQINDAGTANISPDAGFPTFTLGEMQDLDAGAVEAELKRSLRAFSHPFVNKAVNDMMFGRGNPVAGYPGLLHVTAGIHRLGNCSVFYYVNEAGDQVRIVGAGYHLERGNYRLEFEAGELGNCGGRLRLS